MTVHPSLGNIMDIHPSEWHKFGRPNYSPKQKELILKLRLRSTAAAEVLAYGDAMAQINKNGEQS